MFLQLLNIFKSFREYVWVYISVQGWIFGSKSGHTDVIDVADLPSDLPASPVRSATSIIIHLFPWKSLPWNSLPAELGCRRGCMISRECPFAHIKEGNFARARLPGLPQSYPAPRTLDWPLSWRHRIDHPQLPHRTAGDHGPFPTLHLCLPLRAPGVGAWAPALASWVAVTVVLTTGETNPKGCSFQNSKKKLW